MLAINLENVVAELKKLKIPVVYGTARGKLQPPYFVVRGSGMVSLPADDTLHWRENTYQIEYYYQLKDEAAEAVIEAAILGNGWIFSRSEDVYISDGEMYVIYYEI